MTVEEIKDRLKKAGLEIQGEARLPNNTGVILRLKNGSIVNCFDNGNHNVQGKNQEVGNSALGDSASTLASPAGPSASSDKVFVVYGRDPSARTELEAMLRRWDLDPIILDQLPSEGATLIEKLEKYYPNVSFAVVLATPDDEAYPKGNRTRRNTGPGKTS